MMKMFWFCRLLYLPFLISTAFPVKSQIFSSARMLALGGSAAALPAHPGNLLVNPASLNGEKRLVALLGFRYMYYQPDVTAQLFLLHVPVSGLRGSLGIVGRRYGLESVYQDVSVAGSYIRYLAPYFSLSLTAQYNRVHVPGYFDEREPSLGLGAFLLVSEKVNLGGFLRRGMKQDLVPFGAGLGACYRFSTELLLTADLIYNSKADFQVVEGSDIRLAGEYSIVPDYLHLRGGFSVFSRQPYAGFGLTFGKIGLDLASSFHDRLGMSPQFDFSYAFR